MTLTLPDDGHLNAHLDDFLVPLDEVLARVSDALPRELPVGVTVSVVVESDAPLGWSRCVRAAGRRTWWGFRPDRGIPSHLTEGEREAVNTVTAWVRRVSEDGVALVTVYPGAPAPKEIHDPSLTDAERPEAEAFWERHALIAPAPRRIVRMEAAGLDVLAAPAVGAARSLRVRRVPAAHAQVLARAAVPSTEPVGPGDCVLVGRPDGGDWFWIEVA